MGHAPLPLNLEDWIPHGLDLYVIGLQQADWQQSDNPMIAGQLLEHLGPDYGLVQSMSAADLRMVVLTRKRHLLSISQVRPVATMWTRPASGTSGATCVALRFYATQLCFVNCLLADPSEATQARNDDIRCIAYDLAHQLRRPVAFAKKGRAGKWEGDKPTPTVPWTEITTNFDAVFWAGSMFYGPGGDPARLSLVPEVPPSPEEWEALSEHDEFQREQQEAGVLFNFRSGTLDFQPTYPLMTDLEAIKARKPGALDPITGLRAYHPQQEGAMRKPAWPDRILFHALPGIKVRQTDFSACHGICTSPHCPVRSTFTVSTNTLPMRVPPAPPFPGARMRLMWRELRAHLTGSWHLAAGQEDGGTQIVRPNRVFAVFSGRFLENSAAETPVAASSLGLYDWPVSTCPALRCRPSFDGSEVTPVPCLLALVFCMCHSWTPSLISLTSRANPCRWLRVCCRPLCFTSTSSKTTSPNEAASSPSAPV